MSSSPQKPLSDVNIFLQKLRKHYDFLEVKNDAAFFRKIGLSPSTYRTWYSTGIRKIYFFILFLLNKIEKLSKENDKLKKKIALQDNIDS